MKYVLTWAICCSLFSLRAQSQDTVTHRSFVFNSFDFGPAFHITSVPVFSLGVYKGLMSTGNFPIQNTNGFDFRKNKVNNYIPLANFSVGFHLKNSSGEHLRGNPLIRIGVGTGNSTITDVVFTKNQRATVDTIFVPSTNSFQPLDSISREGITIKTRAHFVHLNLMLLFQTNPKNKVCFYGGFALGFGFSYSSYIEYDHFLRWNKQHPLNSGVQQIASDEVKERNTEKLLPYQFYSVSVPVGFDVRFATYTRFWRNMHIFFEIGPTIQYSVVQNNRAEPRSGAYVSFGARFRMFDAPSK